MKLLMKDGKIKVECDLDPMLFHQLYRTHERGITKIFLSVHGLSHLFVSMDEVDYEGTMELMDAVIIDFPNRASTR